MGKDYRRYLQKYAILGVAITLLTSPLSSPMLVYAEGKNIESTEDPQQTSKETDEPEKIADIDNNNISTSEAINNSTAQELEGESATISDESVYQIRIGYEFDDGSFDEWARGSGFLIGDKYLVTSQTLTDVTCNSSLYSQIVTAKADIYKKVGIVLTDAQTTEAHIKIYITDTSGEKVEYSNIIAKNGIGVIILKKAVATPICVFASESTLLLSANDKIKLKFAGKDDTKAIIQTTEGVIFTPEDSEASKVGFYLKADTTNGNALGSPIYNDNGNIVGMVASISSQDESVITAIDQSALQTFLSSNNIDYKTLAQVQDEQNSAKEEQAQKDVEAAQSSVVDTKSLEEALNNANDVDRNSYTEESLADLDNAIEEGQTILDSRTKTQSQTDTAAGNINNAIDSLVRKGFIQKILGMGSNFLLYIGGGIATIALVAITIFIVKNKKKMVQVDKKGASIPSSIEDEQYDDYSENLTASDDDEERLNRNAENIRKAKEEREAIEKESQRKEVKKKKDLSKRNIYEEFEDDDDDFDQEIDVTTRVKPKTDRVPGNVRQKGMMYADETEDDVVSILGDEDDDEGSEDTTILTNRIPKGYLIRTDNGKRIDITKEKFLIGKERKKVDYCIGGDTSVSRIHAMIRIIQDGFYIEDQNSTNYTFVNNNQIPAYKAVYLQDGSIIRISDVEFEFHED